MSDTPKMFPMMRTGELPWEFVQQYEEQAIRFHGQTIKRLAQRGGLAWGEMRGLIEGINVFGFSREQWMKWDGDAVQKVVEARDAWEAKRRATPANWVDGDDRPKYVFRLNNSSVSTTAHILTHTQLVGLSQLGAPCVVAWEQVEPGPGPVENRTSGGVLPPEGSLVIKPGLRVEVKRVVEGQSERFNPAKDSPETTVQMARIINQRDGVECIHDYVECDWGMVCTKCGRKA